VPVNISATVETLNFFGRGKMKKLPLIGMLMCAILFCLSGKLFAGDGDLPIIIYDLTTHGKVKAASLTKDELKKLGVKGPPYDDISTTNLEKILMKNTKRFYIAKDDQITVLCIVNKSDADQNLILSLKQNKSEKELSVGLSIVGGVIADKLKSLTTNKSVKLLTAPPEKVVVERDAFLLYDKASVTITAGLKDDSDQKVFPAEKEVDITCGPREQWFLTAEIPPLEFKKQDNWFAMKQNSSIDNPLLGLNFAPFGTDRLLSPFIHGFVEISKKPFHSYGLGAGLKVPYLYEIVPIVVSMNSCWVDSKHNPPWKFIIQYNISKLSSLL
jgi:hypothetical protein